MKLLTAFVVLYLTLGVAQASTEFPPTPGKRYDVGGYSIHMVCMGHGHPTVLIDTGLGDDSTDWLKVQQAASAQSKVCVYDRPGYGWSDVGPQPRNSAHIAYELERLIEAASLTGPLVLVGHSFGGYNIRMYAANHPENVAGMVLVDASHENQYEALNIQLPKRFGRHGAVLILPKTTTGTMNLDKPTALRERAIHAARSEITALYQSALQVQRLHAIPRVPLIVISRGRSEWQGYHDAAKREKIWMSLQHDLWRLSPISQHIFANRSGHDIHVEQPEVVVKAISDVLTMAR